MRHRHTTTSVLLTSAVALAALALPAMAQGQIPPDLGLSHVQVTGLPTTDIRAIVAGLIRTALGITSIVLIIKIIWGGFLMMTHGGKEDKIKHAKGEIVSGVIGMVVIFTSASFVRFVVDTAMNATGAV